MALVNPKRKSYTNSTQIKNLYSKKIHKQVKNNQGTIMSSGRNSVMSALAKAASKYRSNKPSSQSFIEGVARSDEGYKTIIKNNEDNVQWKSFLSKFTRNAPKAMKDQRSSESSIKNSMSSTKKLQESYPSMQCISKPSKNMYNKVIKKSAIKQYATNAVNDSSKVKYCLSMILLVLINFCKWK